jgi:N-hydroxyarylamine O-acetyltransferase
MRLEPYLERIGFAGEPMADLATLEALHRLHPQAIPFENLSTLLGAPVSLDRGAIEEKLIRQRRGGYCFEHNTLFQGVLEAIGFEPTALAARVVWNRHKAYVNPRTHMALVVEIGRERYLCDVGFGGATLTAPLRLRPGHEQDTPHEPFTINKIDDIFTLSVKFGDDWKDAYEFDLQPQLPIDYEAMNHYVQTWPESPFRRVLMAARPHPGGRVALAGNELSRYESGQLIERRRLATPEALRDVLEDELGIALPDSPGLEPLLARITAGQGP